MTTPSALTDEAVLDAALQAFDGNQAELARSLEVAQSSISRWIAGKSRPEVESALMIARLTGLSRTDVLQAFGHDPLKLGLLDVQGPTPDDRTIQLRELGRMLRRFADQVDALAGRRMAAESQPRHTPRRLSSRPRNTNNYVCQTRRPPVPISRGRITRLGDRRTPGMAS